MFSLMEKVQYETYDSNEVYDNMDLNPTENQVIGKGTEKNIFLGLCLKQRTPNTHCAHLKKKRFFCPLPLSVAVFRNQLKTDNCTQLKNTFQLIIYTYVQIKVPELQAEGKSPLKTEKKGSKRKASGIAIIYFL